MEALEQVRRVIGARLAKPSFFPGRQESCQVVAELSRSRNARPTWVAPP